MQINLSIIQLTILCNITYSGDAGIIRWYFIVFCTFIHLHFPSSLPSSRVEQQPYPRFRITCEKCGEGGKPTRAAFARRSVTREALSLRDAVPERRTSGHAYVRLVLADTVKGWSVFLLPSLSLSLIPWRSIERLWLVTHG